MKILITGAQGFIGKNLVAQLKNIQEGKQKHPTLGQDIVIYEYDKGSDESLLDEYCQQADFVFHLAGVNRPKEESEFMEGNFGFTTTLLDTLKKHNNYCPIMLSSSIQAELDNSYGRSKLAGENAIRRHFEEPSGKSQVGNAFIYRFPNVFGKWCRPNYNSAVATFCHNIAHDLPVQINDPAVEMTLVYIDDVVHELINCLTGKANRVNDYCRVPVEHQIQLGAIVELLYSFKASRTNLQIPDMADAFTKKLYSTYLSYLPETNFSYPLNMHIDERGSFTEFLKSPERGQVSINISKPGITKGQHWHHTKNEKFLVVAGKGIIRFRKIDEPSNIIEYPVSGEKLEVVDIPVGYTHNIENLGDTDMVTVMWVNEVFDAEKPDTYFETV